jgi:leucyl aminopeptidase (aminopeptidase T)
MSELELGLRSIVKNCMHVKSNENVLIVTDDGGESVWLGQLAAKAIDSLNARPIHTILIPRNDNDVEPPKAIAAAMKNVDALIYISDRLEAGHTNANQEAREAGVRCYVINQVPTDDLKRVVSIEDLHTIKRTTEKVADLLSNASFARITSPAGTNITMSIKGRKALGIHPTGKIGVLPDYAEAAVAPVEGTAEGVVVADICIVQWGYVLRAPLHYKVKAGRVIEVTGYEEEVSRVKRDMVLDENANNIAELGLGTSHILPWVIRGTRRDAGRIGTAHIGMARNSDIGGNTWSHIHFDNLISQATVELDDKLILKENKLFL